MITAYYRSRLRRRTSPFGLLQAAWPYGRSYAHTPQSRLFGWGSYAQALGSGRAYRVRGLVSFPGRGAASTPSRFLPDWSMVSIVT